MAVVLIVADQPLSVDFDPKEFSNAIQCIETAVNIVLPGTSVDFRLFEAGMLAAQLNEQTDACFLFGHDGRSAADQADQDAFRRFLQRGGACFATGDHGDLGNNLCGSLEGIGQLRRWSLATGNKGPHDWDAPDTRNQPGRAENDSRPKAIYARWSPTQDVHPLMDMGSGLAIAYLPDHVHEGMLGDVDLTQWAGWTIEEPADCVARLGKQRQSTLLPVVRTAVHENGARLVVDTTIHHWLNAAWRDLQGTEFLPHVQAYAENITVFLLAARHGPTIRRRILSTMLQSSLLRELTETMEDDELGRRAQRHLQRSSPLLARATALTPPLAIKSRGDDTATAATEAVADTKTSATARLGRELRSLLGN